jgi:hypothetical protein
MRESGKPVYSLDNDDFVVIAKMRLAAFSGARKMGEFDNGSVQCAWRRAYICL